MAGYVPQTWQDNNASFPMSATRMTTLEAAVAELKTRWLNVKDYGAIGDGVTDDSTAIQAAINDVPAGNAIRGGVVYLPRGLYRCDTGLTVASGALIRLLGDGVSPGAPNASAIGASMILVGSQQWGLSFNTTNATTNFQGWMVENLGLSPTFVKLTGTNVGTGTWTISNTYGPGHNSLPASGKLWIRDGNKTARITYSTHTSSTLTVTAIDNETPTPGQSYATGAMAWTDALGGIRSFRWADTSMSRVFFAGFANVADSAVAFRNDGSLGISQYNAYHNCWFQHNYIGASETNISSRWVQCNWDNDNAATPPSGTTHYIATACKTLVLDTCNFAHADRLVDIDGGGSGSNQNVIACRFEVWTSDALRFQNNIGAYVAGGSFSNSGNGNIGTAINLGVNALDVRIRPGRINAVAAKIAMDATATGFVELSGTGSPEGAEVAPISSTYRRLDGGAATSLYVKESGTSNTGWIGK